LTRSPDSVYARYKGARAVVLGASGFIGRWVARALNAGGAELTLVVRDRSTGVKIFDEYGIRGDIQELNLQWQAELLGDLFHRIRPSIVFNLAGYGVDRNEREESSAYAINENLVKTLCTSLAGKQASDWTGQQLIHVGSALEYGAIGGDLAENSVPRPTSLYGQSKLAGTNTMTDGCVDNGVRGVTARLFSVYGPGEHGDRLLPSLVAAATANHSLRLTEGKQQRDFTFVEEVAEGLLRIGMMERAPGPVVNLASGQLVSVRTFIEIAANLLSMSPQQLQYGALPVRREEMTHGPVSNTLLLRGVNWVPTVDVRTGIGRTLAFMGLESNV